MHFPKHKKGFIMVEVLIALAVIGILLTSIMQLQSNVVYRVVFNSKTCEQILLAKKELYTYLRTLSAEDKQKNESITEEKINSFEHLSALKTVVCKKAWNSLHHNRSVQLMFAYPYIEKDDAYAK